MSARLDGEGELRRIVLEETDGRAEVFGGTIRHKPPTTFGHNEAVRHVARALILQLPRDQFEVRVNAGHLRISGTDLFIPDVFVVPAEMVDAQMTVDPHQLEVYVDPLPFVVEVWSHAADNEEIDHKISGYLRRGDHEIWRVHPFDRQITRWRRQAGGTYVESILRDGTVTLHALADVLIDLDRLFATE